MLLSFADFGFTCTGQSILEGSYRKKKPSKKSKKKKFANWFESLTVTQLKELCKAAKLPVSGAKAELVGRLLDCETTKDVGTMSVAGLKQHLKEQWLVQSGNKHEMVVRLLHAQLGTGPAKRAATETTLDPLTGQEVVVLKKKRKTTPSPKTIYTRVSKKMQAVSQSKYQSHWGSKRHSPDVYNLMKDFIVDHCLKEAAVDPRLAEKMARAVFQAFADHWHIMESTGYDTEVFREACDGYASVLKAARPLLSATEVEAVVSLLEDVEASVSGHCMVERSESDPCVYYSTGKGKEDSWAKKKENGYGVPKYKDENVIEAAIRVVMPNYKKENRPKKMGKPLNCANLSDWILTT